MLPCTRSLPRAERRGIASGSSEQLEFCGMCDWHRAIEDYIEQKAGELVEIRRHLHAHPEPSGEEFGTTRYLAERLQAAHIPYRIPMTGRGIIADSADPPSEGMAAVRGDIDALRLHDEKSASYRSTRDGIMHACGHDAHAAMVLGAAQTLHACHPILPWKTPWRAIFQPAEETYRGALEMIKAEALDGVRVIVSLHVDPERAVGRVGIRHGVLTAFCEELDVVIRGQGGHAARPHHTVDPISVATQFVNGVYHYIPRSVDSRDPVVVSFGVIEGGANPNVIPELVRLRGTIRTLSRRSSARVKERILAIGNGLADTSQARIDIAFHRGPDSVVNDPQVTRVCADAAYEIVGRGHVDEIALPSMGGEDFAAYLESVPGCMFRLGTASLEGTGGFLHSPRFDIDERAIAVGIKILVHSVVMLCRPQDHVGV
jgi:amidohydrolase